MIEHADTCNSPSAHGLADVGALIEQAVAIFKRRRKSFLITLGTLVALLGLLIFTMSKTYTSEASVIVGSNRSSNSTGDAPTNLPILNALTIVSGIQSGETYAELMSEAPVARDVIRDVGLQTTPRTLMANVKIEPVNNTSIIRISATWGNPATSAAIANAFAKAFIEHDRELVRSQADAAVKFLSAELPGAERQQHAADAALSAFQQRHQVADMNSQTQATVSALASLDVKTGQLALDRRQAEAELQSDIAQLNRVAPTTTGSQSLAPNPVVESLRTQLAQVETQLGTARQLYTEKHPTVIGLENQQRELQREIAREPGTVVSGASTVANPAYEQLAQQGAGYRTEIASDDAGLSEVASQRRALAKRIKSLPSETLALAALERNARQAEAVYGALQQRMSDALIAKSTAISDVTITERASAAEAVAHPSRLVVLLLGLLLSLILAGGVVTVLEYLDRRSRSEEDLRAAFGRRVLGVLPDLDAADEHSLPWLRAMALESLLKLARSIWLSAPRGLRSVAFTSPSAGDGKSTLAINVAWTLAEMQQRVLLVDADLRRPTLHKLLNVPNGLGLSDLLRGEPLASSVRSTPVRNLDLLTSGTPVAAPAFFLETANFSSLLDEARAAGYDRVIVDLPAILPVVDAATIVEKLDGTVLVVSAATTTVRSAREAVAYVDGLGVPNLLGLVVNRVRRDLDVDDHYYLQTQGAPLALP